VWFATSVLRPKNQVADTLCLHHHRMTVPALALGPPHWRSGLAVILPQACAVWQLRASVRMQSRRTCGIRDCMQLLNSSTPHTCAWCTWLSFTVCRAVSAGASLLLWVVLTVCTCHRWGGRAGRCRDGRLIIIDGFDPKEFVEGFGTSMKMVSTRTVSSV
jgi:hypothetical protein